MFRRFPLAVLLAVLLIIDGIKYWPPRHSGQALADARNLPRRIPGLPEDLRGADAFPEPAAAMRQRLDAMLQRIPEEQRKAIQDHLEKDRIFFASLRNLPEEQRRQKIAEYFAQNPPPPGFDPTNGGAGIGGPGGPGGPEDGGAFPIPPPAERRSLDQQVADSQRQMEGS